MSLRERFTEELKTAMLAKDAARVSALRLITSEAEGHGYRRPARPAGVRRRHRFHAARHGQKAGGRASSCIRRATAPIWRPKEQAEIDVIDAFLPAGLDAAALAEVVAAIVTETGASSMKDMGKVMAALKAKYGATLDPAAAGSLVKAALAG